MTVIILDQTLTPLMARDREIPPTPLARDRGMIPLAPLAQDQRAPMAPLVAWGQMTLLAPVAQDQRVPVAPLMARGQKMIPPAPVAQGLEILEMPAPLNRDQGMIPPAPLAQDREIPPAPLLQPRPRILEQQTRELYKRSPHQQNIGL